jgi:hypothetical protein
MALTRHLQPDAGWSCRAARRDRPICAAAGSWRSNGGNSWGAGLGGKVPESIRAGHKTCVQGQLAGRFGSATPPVLVCAGCLAPRLPCRVQYHVGVLHSVFQTYQAT